MVLVTTMLVVMSYVYGQNESLPNTHPRYLTTNEKKAETLAMIEQESWAKNVFDKLCTRTDVYADREADWLSSRLKMYWNTHATEVYIRGDFYDHAGGEVAPVPTVMFSGARSHATNYLRPRLEDLVPYEEDERGLYLANGSLDGHPYEWVHISQTGNIIQSINVEILEHARDAAFLWWATDEEKYAEMATQVFDTYMTGIYYRNVPQDLNHGHIGTLVGMSSFEVIHEDALNVLVPLYDFLYDYLAIHRADKMDIYAYAFKKWADNIISNGVPHNNWDLIQARFIMNIALILEENDSYADHKGREYYIDYVVNQSSIRQWSLKALSTYGFSPETGIWAECPGYSMNVVGDYADFVTLFESNLDTDLTNDIPIILKAAKAIPQYLFPNKLVCGFGDTHPTPLRTDIFRRLIVNAQRYGKREQERDFTAMLKLFDPSFSSPIQDKSDVRVDITSFFAGKPLAIDESTPAGDINDYVTPTFYSHNVSWLVARNGMDPRHSLMYSLNASEGNHMHANGISMELYGKGYTLAPDAGIGVALYSGQDYLEYYSQFPAHNTVCVDGISAYPIMKSNHSFTLINCFPQTGQHIDYQPVSYSTVSFHEPEADANQMRILGIVNTSDSAGYYIDIFRSRKVAEDDKLHDYFYHNLGSRMTLTTTDHSDLSLQPTEELAFAGAHLYAYSYLYDKMSANTEKDVRADFTIDMPDGDNITMTMWMRGEENREVFQALSPMTEGLSRLKDMPYNVAEQPTLTFVARQQGEAWKHPFVAVFEPSSVSEPSNIQSVTFPTIESSSNDTSKVGICVALTNGSEDIILSSDDCTMECSVGAMRAKATYALERCSPNGTEMCFLGGGTFLTTNGITIDSFLPNDVLLRKQGNHWHYIATKPCTITIGKKKYSVDKGEGDI